VLDWWVGAPVGKKRLRVWVSSAAVVCEVSGVVVNMRCLICGLFVQCLGFVFSTMRFGVISTIAKGLVFWKGVFFFFGGDGSMIERDGCVRMVSSGVYGCMSAIWMVCLLGMWIFLMISGTP